MKLSLIVMQGKPDSKEIPIRMPQFVIGRDPECHLRPASPLVSKRHCALFVRENKVFLKDFDSTNGTLLRGEPLKGEAELQDGDEFKVGPLSFRVKLQVTAVDTPTPMPFPSPAKAPAAAKPASAPRRSEEDAVAELLFEGGPGSPGSDVIPSGSTIMELPANAMEQLNKPAAEADAAKEETRGQAPKEGLFAKKEVKKVVQDQAATANAAKAILDKYMRRPRS